MPLYPTIQKFLFHKNYIQLQKQLQKIPSSSIQQNINKLFIETVQIKLQLFKTIKSSSTNKQSLQRFQHNIQRLYQNYNHLKNYQLKKLILLSLTFFVFQLTPKKDHQPKSQSNPFNQLINTPGQYGSTPSQYTPNNNHYLSEIKNSSTMQQKQELIQQKTLIKQLLCLPTVTQYIADTMLIKQIKSSLYLFISFIELQTKKLIKCKRKQNKEEIYFLLELLNQLIENYPQTFQFANKIQLILIHLRIYYLNSSVDVTYNKAIEEMSQLVVSQYNKKTKRLKINSQTIVVLLYNILKILLGIDSISEQLMSVLSIIFKHYNMPTPNHYNQTIFRLFIVIKIAIFKQCQTLTNNNSNNTSNIKSSQLILTNEDDQDGLEVEGQDPILAQTFSTFININLDTTIVQLKQVSRNIVRHRVASLATIIGFKLGIQNFAIDFLHLMHDSPFNNDIQTIKLCFQLFQARQFSKLQHLFQIVLSASTCKNLKQREVLIAMCSIFIGIYLQNREQGLLYAKLNHYENKLNILRQQTLLQHLGFSYYNLAKSEIYLENRQIYLVKALENLKKSYDLNPNNYVVTYCLAKIYLKLYDNQNAYKYALQSCKCNRGRWVPFALLSCVYMVQRKINKSMIIIDQLIKKYPQQTLLYYIRAYIQANKILLQVEYDEQVQASKEMDEEIYQLTRDRILKSKSLTSLNMYCQQFYNKSRSEVKEIDQNYFNIANNFIQESHEQNGEPSASPCERKSLLMIIELFIQVEQLQTAEGLLKTIPEYQQTSESKYFHALIHQKRKQYGMALSEYKKILQKDNFHVNSLIKCGLLQVNNSQSLNYITLASKYTNNNEFLFVKGNILSRLERFQQAHECFIRQAQTAWLQQLPQKLYYY